MLKNFRVFISVSGLTYSTIVRARTHAHAATIMPNGMGGKVRTVLLKGGPPVRLAFPPMRLH